MLEKLQRMKDQKQQRVSSPSKVADFDQTENIPPKSLNLYLLKQQKICTTIESLVTSLETKDPNFSLQWLNLFAQSTTMTEVLPILFLLLSYFKVDAVVQGNLSVRQEKRAIMKQLQLKMQLIVGLTSTGSQSNIEVDKTPETNKKLLHLRSSYNSSQKKE